MTHRTTLDVRFNEIDPYGHVNHSVYVTYFEVGRTEALQACEIPLDVMAERGYQLVVTKLEVRFRQPATAGETLVIETGLSEMRRASGTWHQKILRPAGSGDTDDEQLLVSGEVTAAVTDRNGRPTRPPDWMFPALEPLRVQPLTP